MKKQKSTHGGPNRNQGRRAPEGKRITISVCLTPENTAFLKALGKEKNNWLNTIIEKERIDYARFLEATNSLKDAKD